MPLDNEDIKNWYEDHSEGIMVLVIVTVILGGFGGMIYYGALNWEKIPIVEREVIGLVVADEYTECVFLVDGKKYISHEYPCTYEVGEKVKTKFDNRITIID